MCKFVKKNNMSKIALIKKDAITSINVGTGFLSSLQKLLMFILENKTEEEINNYTNELSLHKSMTDQFSETWMDHLKVVSVLISTIEKQMIDEGKIEEKEIEDLTPGEN